MKTPTTLAVRPFPDDLLIALKVISAQEKRPLSEIVPELLRAAIKNRAKEK